MELHNIIVQQILERGPLSFHDFMEMALYHPSLGYYNSPAEKIGKGGDFFTSPAYTSVFGKMVGKQIAEMIQLANQEKFTILEIGAGQGLLCCDVLQYLQEETLFADRIDYCILEKSKSLKEQQQKLVPSGVRWIDDLDAAAPLHGCVLANEVLDNFSVHVVKKEAGDLWELYIDVADNSFIEAWQTAPPALVDYLEVLQVDLPEGSRAEINLEAINWLQDMSAMMEASFILLIDYGCTSAELYGPHHQQGTLRCFKKHRLNDRPLLDVGLQDITADVNFSALTHWSSEYGLTLVGYTSQANFLLALGFSAYLRKLEQLEKSREAAQKKLCVIQTFFLEMGRKLKVLILQKGFVNPALTGVQFMDTRVKLQTRMVK